MDVELRHLRYFVAVAEELHFGRAAATLQIAQPALSQQIRKLERALDTELLVRTSRSVALTPAGAVLLERARGLLEVSARHLEEAARVGRGEQGRIDVGFVSSAVPLGPIDGVQRLRRIHPLVEVHLHEGFTSQLLTQLAHGRLDVATVRDPDDQSGIAFTPLASEPLVAMVPVGHPAVERGTIESAELVGEPFVFFPRSAGDAAHGLGLRPVTDLGHRPRIAQESSSWPTIMYLVGAGFGVSIAPQSASIGAPATVRILPFADSTVRSTMYFATRSDDDRPIVRQLAKLSAPRAAAAS